ncbi:MAG: response regulator [Vicinamibacterales bacterium]
MPEPRPDTLHAAAARTSAAILALQRRQEDKLAASMSMLHATIESTADGILVVDLAGRLRICNSGFAATWRIPAEMLAREDLDEISAHIRALLDDPGAFDRRLRAALRTPGIPCRDTLVLVDGRVLSQLVTPQSVEGRCVGVVFNVRDVTERRRSDEQLRALAARAEAASRAKSEFLAKMSHEIRTPMNGIIGMSDLLVETRLTDEQRRFAEVIRASGETLLAVINDILDFSKIEAGKLELETADFDLTAVMESLTEILAVKAVERGLELTCLVAPDVPERVSGDATRLRQVLLNLGNNAVKFTHDGLVAITVAVDPAAGPGALRFTVRDTGIGIAPHRLGELFAPFTQADGSTTRKYGGTGLGLTISKQLVSLMGGELAVESAVGGGSTFTFAVPLPPAAAAADASPSPVPALAGVRALVVDDHDINRLLLTTILGAWGCECAEAGDGASALAVLDAAAAAGRPFGLALVDLQMPGMDGRELGRRIKATPALAPMRLVLLSSHVHLLVADEVRAEGFEARLFKPVRRSQLAEVLRRAMAPRGASGPAPASASGPAPAPAAVAPRRLLLADDNPVNVIVTTAMLRKMGCIVDVVHDGRQAVQALIHERYDAVLMDCEMPEMDGFEATARIRDPETGCLDAHVPVVALTANALAGDRERCLAAGMSDYLSKPVKADALRQVLARCLPAPGAGGGGVTTPSGPTLEYFLDGDDRIVAVNPVWDLAARSAEADHLTSDGVSGRSLWEFIADPGTQRLYRSLLARVRRGQAVTYGYRCDTLAARREMRMHMRLVGDQVRFASETLSVRERQAVHLWNPAAPRDARRVLHVCGWCKKVHASGVWLEVEEALVPLRLLDLPLPALAHGVCPACVAMVEGLDIAG